MSSRFVSRCAKFRVPQACEVVNPAAGAVVVKGHSSVAEAGTHFLNASPGGTSETPRELGFVCGFGQGFLVLDNPAGNQLC